MSHIAKWACDICEHEFKTKEEADKCELRGRPAPTASAGDIVTIGKAFGWYDGNREWIANADEADPRKTGHAADPSECPFSFYYVVTALDFEDRYDRAHRPRYHLATLAMKPTSGYHSGYTFDGHSHYAPTLVSKPPVAVARAAKKLIGQIATILI